MALAVGNLDTIELPMVPAEERRTLEVVIMLEVDQTAIGNLKAGKTPGPNGLPAEFLNRYSRLLIPYLLDLCREAQD
ncbi:hypothetical protein NDU88_003770 [Pleurodeles waltl]|uniref:Uncharacterized protein n=1 Tax=Pleurodeles waltl TaxID=8319 RepID=A0AAV7L2R2_PLEWA|nr:hypothetical protein NDU88_003770 [Pleurodeles waltl]